MPDLTKQEVSLMRLLANGAMNTTAARHFGVSTRTVESRRQRIMLKFGAESPVQLGYLFAKWEAAAAQAV